MLMLELLDAGVAVAVDDEAAVVDGAVVVGAVVELDDGLELHAPTSSIKTAAATPTAAMRERLRFSTSRPTFRQALFRRERNSRTCDGDRSIKITISALPGIISCITLDICLSRMNKFNLIFIPNELSSHEYHQHRTAAAGLE
jgi:hypothetical protein